MFSWDPSPFSDLNSHCGRRKTPTIFQDRLKTLSIGITELYSCFSFLEGPFRINKVHCVVVGDLRRLCVEHFRLNPNYRVIIDYGFDYYNSSRCRRLLLYLCSVDGDFVLGPLL